MKWYDKNCKILNPMEMKSCSFLKALYQIPIIAVAVHSHLSLFLWID